MFHDEEAVAVKDVSKIDGIPLEDIIEQPSGTQLAAVLVRKDWYHLYFLNIRYEWQPNQYFELAEKLIREQKIKNP